MTLPKSVDAPVPQAATLWSRRWFWYWGPVIVYAAGIVFLSSTSGSHIRFPLLQVPFGDKILHAGLYGGLALLTMRAFRHAGGSDGARHALTLAIVATAVFGLTDELHQLFVPNRHADPWDWLADTAGAIAATLSWTKLGEPARESER